MEENRQKKIRLMQIIVGAIVLIIAILWIINIKNVWRFNNLNLGSSEQGLDWDEIKNSFSNIVEETKDNFEIEKTKQIKENGQILVDDLIKKTEELVSSSTEPVSSSTETVNCPEYIDCMPTIGEPKPCQIPVGCEGITQIAY